MSVCKRVIVPWLLRLGEGRGASPNPIIRPCSQPSPPTTTPLATTTHTRSLTIYKHRYLNLYTHPLNRTNLLHLPPLHLPLLFALLHLAGRSA